MYFWVFIFKSLNLYFLYIIIYYKWIKVGEMVYDLL